MPCAMTIAFNPLPPNDNLPGLHIFTYILLWMTSLINPFIYVISNNFYRQAFKKTFGLMVSRAQGILSTAQDTSKMDIMLKKGSSSRQER